MEDGNRKVLVAVNGSDDSMTAVRYISESLPKKGSELTLYQVMSAIPEEFWDLEKDPVWIKKVEVIRSWETEQKRKSAAFMEQARAVFETSGFPADAVSFKIGEQKEGIARDLISECTNKYDVLVIGRGESAHDTNMPLGGVTSKLLANVSSTSIWMMGGKPHSTRVLIALDSSPRAIHLAEHAAKMFDCRKLSITLFHAVRGISVSMQGLESIFPDDYAKNIIQDAQAKIDPIFDRARSVLIEAGVAADNIAIKTVNGVSSRATAIVEEAAKTGCGTIVCGRRGVTQVADFSMGRVANKLTQLVHSQALCIVA